MPLVEFLQKGYLSLLRAVGHQRWLRRGIRTRVIRLALKATTNYDNHFDIELFGYAYAGSLKNWIDWNIYFLGGYEDEVLELIKHLAASKPSKVFLDVGANVGLHSLFASRYFAEVDAFEPYPPVRDRLLRVVKQNTINNLVIHDVGLGSLEKYIPFFAPPDENLGAGSFLPQYSKLNSPYGTLRIVVGDEYLRDKISALDVVKIDVEGYEVEVLKGLRQTLERYRPDLILELSNATREQLGSLPALLALLPNAYCAFDIVSREVWVGVIQRQCLRLGDLNFDSCNNNIYLVPEERIPVLRKTGLAGL